MPFPTFSVCKKGWHIAPLWDLPLPFTLLHGRNNLVSGKRPQIHLSEPPRMHECQATRNLGRYFHICLSESLLKTPWVNKLIAINAFPHSIFQFASFTESSLELDRMSCRPSPFMRVKTSWRTGETTLQRKYLWVKPYVALLVGPSRHTTCHHQNSHREKCWASSEFCCT